MDELAFHTRLHHPGTILDVGAHDGLIALPLSRLPGSRLIAFEPLPPAFARLRATFEAVYDGTVPSHVSLRPEALGDRPGRAMLSVPVLDGVAQEQWASTAKTYAPHLSDRLGVERHEVPVVTLDELGVPDLTHVKLDAEGFEYEVLRGGRETLRRCRPVLSIEVEERHREGSTWAVPAFLDGLGYETRFWLDGRMHPLSALDRATMQRASADPAEFSASDPYVFVFFAWPEERSAKVLAALGTA